MTQAQWMMDSPIGPLYLVASEKGLQGVYWIKQKAVLEVNSLSGSKKEIKILAETVRQLDEYFEGKRKEFKIPFDVIVGIDFQKSVWNELKKIPYGETRSYGEIAHQLKKEGASRAVGGANGKNPLSIVVPCHRVIGSNGTLTGFAGGLNKKSKLLELELKHVKRIDSSCPLTRLL